MKNKWLVIVLVLCIGILIGRGLAVLEDTCLAQTKSLPPVQVPAQSEDEIYNPNNWHKVVFNKAEWVVYSGKGQIFFHHWVEPKVEMPKTTDKPKENPKTK